MQAGQKNTGWMHFNINYVITKIAPRQKLIKVSSLMQISDVKTAVKIVCVNIPWNSHRRIFQFVLYENDRMYMDICWC